MGRSGIVPQSVLIGGPALGRAGVCGIGQVSGRLGCIHYDNSCGGGLIGKAVGSLFNFWVRGCTMFDIIMVGLGVEEVVVRLVLLVINLVMLVGIYHMDYFWLGPRLKVALSMVEVMEW